MNTKCHVMSLGVHKMAHCFTIDKDVYSVYDRVDKIICSRNIIFLLPF